MTHTVEANWNSGRVWGMTPVCMDPADGQVSRSEHGRNVLDCKD